MTDYTVVRRRPGNRNLVVGSIDAPRVPVVLSEFGGVAFSGRDDTWSGYGAVREEQAFAERLAALVAAANSAGGLAGFCYTQLTDTLQERNGLLTEAREFKTDPARIAETVTGR